MPPTPEVKIEVEAQDLLDAVTMQRDRALNEAANAKAMAASLVRQVTDLKRQLAEKAKPADAAS